MISEKDNLPSALPRIGMDPPQVTRFVLFAALFILLYHSAYHWLVTADWAREDYSASYFIPAIVLYLIWERRRELAAIPSVKSWWGLWLFLPAFVLFWLGELSGEFFSLYLSSWLMAAGLLWLHLGWRKLKHIGFPLFLALFMFPLPNILYTRLSLKLKMLSSQLGVGMLRMSGMSAYREGNVIDLGFTQLQVVDACNGLRYLIPLIVLGMLVAYFYKDRLWKRILLVLSTIPLAIVTNGLRIASVGFLYPIWGAKVAEGFFHDFSGWFIFMVTLALLLVEMHLLKRIFPFDAAANRLGGQPPAVHPEPEEGAALRNSAGGWHALLARQTLLAICLMALTAAIAQGVEFRERIPIKRSFNQFPETLNGWSGQRQSMESRFIEALDFSDYVIVDYRNQGGKTVNFYTAYYETQRKGESIHSPSTCLPGSGWVFQESGDVAVRLDDGREMRVNRAFMEKGPVKELTYYWFPQRGRILTSAWELKLYVFWDALTRQRTDGALVRLITPVYESERIADAENRLQGFVRAVVPVLDEFIPGGEKIMMFFAALFSSVLVSLALTPVLCTLANRLHMVDIPNERKVHSQPTPRVGGIAMAAAAFATILIGYDAAPFIRAYLLSAAILVAFGVVDDFRELSPRFKFAGQGLAALTMIFWGGVKITSLGALLPDGVLLPDAIAVPLTLIAIVGATNAINLADGLDGLAGGISLLVFSGIAYLGYVTGNVMVVFLSLAIIGGVFGFLRFNTHPASIFMGDTGSQFLGFSAVTLAIGLTQQVTVLSPMLPLLLLGFPILDTLNVMVTRMAQGRSPFSPDKNHFHHNLMKMGFLHTEAVVAIYALQTLLIAGAIIFRHYSDWLLLGGYLGFSLMVLTLFRVARARAWQPHHLRIFDLRLACLKRLRREGLVIRPVFRVYRIVFALLLLATILLATGIPVYAGVSALFLAAGVLLAWGFIPGQLPAVLRVALYLFVPPAVYFSDTVLAWNLSDTGQRLYHLSFGVLAVLVVLTTKFSRRSQGFKSSPMDFLIITLAVIAPNLPDRALQTHHLGLVAAKIIVLYYGFEVLISELRGKCDGLAAASVVAMVLFALL